MQSALLQPLQPARRPLAAHGRHVRVIAAAHSASRYPQQRQQPPLAAAGGWAAAAAAAALLLSAHPGEAKELIQGFPKVVDGDTLDFSGTRVRLFGIDAPETKQSCTAKGGEYLCGEKAKQALAAKIGGAPVQCEQKNRDKYGRVVGICSLGGGKEDLNAWMVQEGYAVAYRQYSKAYVPLEEAAQAARKGIWSGTFELPQRWRQEHPRGGSSKGPASPAAAPAAAPAPAAAVASAAGAGGAAVPPPGCAIKGNITAKGERIYHIPGGSYYDRTVIEPQKGERFFCSEAEAQAAGWRPSRS